jgi:hypothetical protein
MASPLRRIDPNTRYVHVVDDDGNETLTSITELLSSDLEEAYLSRDVLGEILTELKKMNLHLQAMTDEVF